MPAKLISIGAIILLIRVTTSDAQTSFERDLATLDEQHDKAIASAIEPIERRYQAALEQLMQRATLNTDLDTALKIKEKLSTLRQQSLEAMRKGSAFVGTWQELEGGTLTVLADGTARHSNGAAATWGIKENNMVFTWNNGAKHIFPSSQTGNALHGVLIRSGGKSQPWEWTRVH
jgi:hypothetical protein